LLDIRRLPRSNYMRNASLIFLIKKSEGKIEEVCLAMKKRGFGVGRWNGVGGKVQEGESIEEAARREAKEEIEVDSKDLLKVAELTFTFPHNESWNQIVHVYFCTNWNGEPKESEEMNPRWFRVKDIPYSEMWPDDKFWLPKVLEGKLIVGSFEFGEGDAIQKQVVEVVSVIS
jgi:8-oxo-dGTP diphosphatase/2-hydroxy-dATP diphosphatase